MATTVLEIIKVEFDDGTKIDCKPLKIKNLRKFMEKIAKLTDSEVATDNDKSFDVLLECSQIALEQYTKKEYTKDELEEILDLPTMYRIIEGASGIVIDEKDDSPN